MKNILKNACLKFWLAVFALIPALSAVGQDNTSVSPSDLDPITTPYFFYYNGGIGFGGDGEIRGSHYRHLNGQDIGQSGNNIWINGAPVESYNNSASETSQKGSILFKKGQAIGVKLANGKKYRVKIYLYDTGSGDTNKILYKGSTAADAVKITDNVSQTQINYVGNEGPEDSNTRLMTYEIADGGNEVYWIKNGNDAEISVGGFEILPYEENKDNAQAQILTTDTGWYVEDNTNTVNNALDYSNTERTQRIDYLKSDNGVDVFGPAMAINSYSMENGHKSVMLNQKNKVGVILRPGATLTVTFLADSPEADHIVIKDYNNDAILEESYTGSSWNKTLTYTSTSLRKVWITTSSDTYLYFQGFNVTAGNNFHQMSEVSPITENYKWTAINGKQIAQGAKDGDHTLNVSEPISENGGNVTIQGEQTPSYKISGDNIIGIKIQGSKGKSKGKLILYYSGIRLRLYGSLTDALNKNINALGLIVGDDGNHNVKEFNLSEGEEVTYWISTDGGEVNFAGYEVVFDEEEIVHTELVTITDYNIYKVGDKVPASGDILSYTDSEGNYIAHTKYTGNGTSVVKNKVMVLGQTNNALVIKNDKDYLGLRVGECKKDDKIFRTGHIKVYFNGTNTGEHGKMELPLANDYDLSSGEHSSYDAESQTVTLIKDDEYPHRGWWFGDKGFSKYNTLLIQFEGAENITGVGIQLQDIGEGRYSVDMKNGIIMVDLVEAQEKGLDLEHLKQAYIYRNGTSDSDTKLKIKSARMFYKPISIATGSDENNVKSDYQEVFGGLISDVQNAQVYDYPFDLTNAADNEQLYWITGNDKSGSINIAAIEVIYDNEQHAKVVDWYVNKDTKMIVGSDDPHWVWTDFSGNPVSYPKDKNGNYYDEYVTFYMSAGRQASVSFIMPEAVHEVYDWELAMKAAKNYIVKTIDSKGKTTDYIDEAATDNKIPKDSGLKKLSDSYGKHTITSQVLNKIDAYGNELSVKKSDEKERGVWFNKNDVKKYDRHAGQSEKMNKISGKLYEWYTYSFNLPSAVEDTEYTNSEKKKVTREYVNQDFYAEVLITATQKKDGDENTTDDVNGKKGEWTICMRFVAYQSPVFRNDETTIEGKKTTKTVTLKSSSNSRSNDIYYTFDSSDPNNGVSGKTYKYTSGDITQVPMVPGDDESGSKYVSDMNCIFKAAQYIETPYEFYPDCALRDDKDNKPTNILKVVSNDLHIVNDKDEVVYVKDNGKKEENQLFNFQKGGYTLSIPTAEGGEWLSEDNTEEGYKSYDKPFSSIPMMYITLGGRTHPYWNGNKFAYCGTDWKASSDDGLKTYLDSYRYKFDVQGIDISEGLPWYDAKNDITKENQNPYTECNGGVGGADTEEGGMFLQPISGTMLRFEPEYDGVITVWLRQNGCLDNKTLELGTFTRRPVYVMDENGRIMTRTTIKPTADHYLGINGTYAINSNMCEERSQVEHTWLYAVAKQVFANHPVYSDRFKNFPNRWTLRGTDDKFEYMSDDNSRGGAIMYGWWYKGFNIDATIEDINSASHVSRYEYMEPNLLYRSDKVFDMEMNTLGLNNTFAKYGYELPNFQYVRYRIPVKAGKTYYIAGRGTKNGFSAIRFDRVKCNTNCTDGEIENLRFSDNPTITENTDGDRKSSDYLKLKEIPNEVGNSSTLPKDDDIKNSYSDNTDEELKESVSNSEWINKIIDEGKDKTGLSNLEGKTLNVELKRSFTAGHWHPILLPFSISETRLEQYFGEGTKVLYLDPYEHTMKNSTDEKTGKSWVSAYNAALENSTLYFTLHRYQMIYANTPAFICPTFKWSADYVKKKGDVLKKIHPDYELIDNKKEDGYWLKSRKIGSVIFKRVTIDGSNIRRDKEDGLYGYAINEEYEVVGSYDSKTLEGGEIYFIDYDNTNNASYLRHALEGTEVTMMPTRVWIQPIDKTTNVAPIRKVGAKTFSELDFDFDAEQAGISDIVTDDVTVERYLNDDGVYDLLGRKMGEGSLDGLPAGIYIFQGKKVYVK